MLKCISSLFLISFISSCDAAIRKRDATLDVPLALDSLGQYFVNVNMSSSNPQPFNFALSLGTGYSAVAGTACDSCTSGPTYNISTSSSAHTFSSGQQNVTVPGASASGQIIKEDCTLKVSNGPSWSYPNQTIILLNQSSNLLPPSTSGIFGLGTNKQSGGDFQDTVFGGYFTRNPDRTTFTYGMALNAPTAADNTNGGVLHWLEPDSSFYEGSPVFQPVISSPNSTSDWLVALNSWTFSTGGKSISSASQSMQTVVDTFYTNIYFPQDEAQLIYAAIPGSSPQASSGLSQVFSVPCNTQMSLATVFGNQTFILDQSTLVINTNGTCIGAIEAWNDANNAEYLLGATFISSVYLIFSVSMNAPDSIGFAKRFHQKQSSLSGGAIAGIVVGSLAFVCVIAGCIFFFIRSRRAQLTEGVTDGPMKEGAIQPYPITPASRDGFLLHGSPAIMSDSHTGHAYSTMEGVYSPVPQSPTSTSRDSWRDSQQPQVSMTIERNQNNMGNSVAPTVVDDGHSDSLPPTFTEATRHSQVMPLGTGKR